MRSSTDHYAVVGTQVQARSGLWPLTHNRIIFRAIQGIGGAGTYSLVIVILFELVPPPKFANNTAMISSVFALGLVLGPLVGGLINEYTTWRWVFLLKYA